MASEPRDFAVTDISLTTYPQTITSANTNIQVFGNPVTVLNDTSYVRPEEPKRLSDREWLDDQVNEVCELVA